jgi:dihydroflavonol-4-reductase
MKTMDIAVTGAHGHLGINLIRSLLADGHSIRAIDINQSSALDSADVEFVKADTTDRQAMESAFSGAEIVYHLAARISVTGDKDGSVWRTNVDGAATAGRAALATNIRRYVHVSSVHALDLGKASSPISEDADPTLRSSTPVYDRSKATAERFVLDLVSDGLDAVIVQPTAIIGPDDRGVSRMGTFFQRLIAGRMPAIVGGAFDWVDARDVAEGMISAVERAPRGRKYLLGGTRHGHRAGRTRGRGRQRSASASDGPPGDRRAGRATSHLVGTADRERPCSDRGSAERPQER